MKVFKDSNNRPLPDAPYEKAADLQSDVVRINWLNWAIHVQYACSKRWKLFYYPKHRLAILLPHQTTDRKPYSIFHPEKPYTDGSTRNNDATGS